MNAERALQWWTGLATIPPDQAAAELGRPVCRCAPGVCEHPGDELEVNCDECGNVMLGSTAARAIEAYREAVKEPAPLDA